MGTRDPMVDSPTPSSAMTALEQIRAHLEDRLKCLEDLKREPLPVDRDLALETLAAREALVEELHQVLNLVQSEGKTP